MKKKVWYCSYGSNLLEERFKLYIEGGTSPLVNKTYEGCTDKTMPTKSKLYKINYEMYFAEKAEFWEDKAVAFISHKTSKSFTYARLYLISVEQFHEIVTQENTQFSSSSISQLIDLKELESNGSLLLGSPDENKLYGKVILVGKEEGFPIITFTSKIEIDKVEFKKPGEKYLGTIIRGLKETSDLSTSKNLDFPNILSYFENLKGIKGKIKTKKLKNTIILNTPLKKEVLPTGQIKRKGEFVSQIGYSSYKNMLPQYKILQSLIIKSSIINHIYKKSLPQYGILERIDKQVKMKVKLKYLDDLDVNNIKLDQKIRCALGAKKRTFDDKGDVIVFTPIKNEIWFKLILNRISNSFIHFFFGIQTNIVRTQRASYTDMETDVCRIKRETMNIIGVVPGDYVVIKSITKKTRIRALELTPDLEKEIKKRKKKDKDDYNCFKRLDLNRIESNDADLDPIFLDFDARKKLGIDQCYPVQIQRSVFFEIKKKLHYVATPLIITIIGILLSLKYFENEDIFIQILILSVAVFLITVLTVMTIKKL